MFWLLLAGMFIYSHKKGGDFRVFFTAGERVLNNISVYQLADGWMPFKYHPAWAAFFSVWALMTEKVALFFFNVLQLACWIYGAKIWAVWLGFELKTWNQRLLLLVASLSALSCDMGYGQINGFAFLGMTLVFKYMETGTQKPLTAGFLVGLLVSLKLNFGLLFFYLIFKNPRSLIGVFLSFIFLHILLVACHQEALLLDHYRSWFEVMMTQSSTQFHIYESQGLLRFFLALSFKYGSALWLFSMMIYVLFGYYAIRKNKDFPWVPLYWMAGSYLFSPLAWWYQILFLYPLIFYLLRTNLNKIERGTVLVCLFLYAFCNFNTLGPKGIILFKDYYGYFILSCILVVLFLKSGFMNFKKSLIKPS